MSMEHLHNTLTVTMKEALAVVTSLAMNSMNPDEIHALIKAARAVVVTLMIRHEARRLALAVGELAEALDAHR